MDIGEHQIRRISTAVRPSEAGQSWTSSEPYGRTALARRLLGDFRLRHGESTVALTPRAEHLLVFLALLNNPTRIFRGL